MACNWFYFPNTQRAPEILLRTVQVFNTNEELIASETHSLNSNEVLAVLSDDLEECGYAIERGKKKDDLLEMPVLFKENGITEKVFYADGFHDGAGVVLEVEAGRAVANNQFLKDFFEACMMVDAKYLCIAVRNTYTSNSYTSKDFERVCTFFKTLYASNRLNIPLEGLLVIGY